MEDNQLKIFTRLAEIGNSYAEFIPNEYLIPIVEKYHNEIMENINETADPNDWNTYDLGLAIGRVLCDQLGIEN